MNRISHLGQDCLIKMFLANKIHRQLAQRTKETKI